MIIVVALVFLIVGRLSADFEFRRILGCEKHLYMTRIVLLRTRRGKLMINYFHRSDEDRALHDHPWTFHTFILWRGYWEHTKNTRRRIRPLTLNHRSALWLHRVELVDSKPACTLVWTGRKERNWGFLVPERGLVDWQTFGRDYCE